MTPWRRDKTISRLNQMIDNAMEGKPIEQGFDETKISALETKLSDFLAMNRATKNQLSEEKLQINQLISDISHQTKTPLANVLLYAQLLEEGELSPQDRASVTALVEQAQKLHFLIATLVKTSRLEVGVIAVRPTPQSLHVLFQTLSKQVFHIANQKEIAVVVEETDIFAIFDLKWTTEAVYNILDNAIKYTPNGGRVRLRATAYELFISIDIADTGMGICEEETASIFTRFYRSPSVSDLDGMGIGLYLAREIVAKQGGYIKVSSKIGVGSTFSVFLPKISADP